MVSAMDIVFGDKATVDEEVMIEETETMPLLLHDEQRRSRSSFASTSYT